MESKNDLSTIQKRKNQRCIGFIWRYCGYDCGGVCFSGGFVMETLEELKSIVAGKPDGSEFVSLCGSSFAKFKGGKFLQFINGEYLEVKNCNIYSRSLSDIERIIDLMEQLNKIEPVKEECKHPSITASYTHVTCDSCCMIRTDGGWGCASRKWFENIESAKFYEKNGFLPK